MIDRVISECRRIDRSNEAGLLIEQILNSDGQIRARQQAARPRASEGCDSVERHKGSDSRTRLESIVLGAADK